MRALLLLGALVLGPILLDPAMAQSDTDAASAYRDATRQSFLRAYAKARQGAFSSTSDIAYDLRNYPLYPYLSAAQLRHELGAHPDPALDERIARFVDAQGDLPPAMRLKSAWLASLADRDRWQTVVQETTQPSGTTERCRRLTAEIHLGTASSTAARTLYDVGHSQPSACDPVFDWLEANGLLTPDLIRSRAHKAILAGDTGLASYLARQMPGGNDDTIATWLGVIGRPAGLNDAVPSLDDDIVVAAFKHYALSDPQAAADALPGLIRRFSLDAGPRYEMQRYIALLFAEEHRPEALLWYARVDHDRMARAEDDHALGWEIRAAIYARRWPLVIDFINRLPADIAKDEEWRYWKARALAASGNKQAADALYRQLAGQRSYHGYLAADALDIPYRFNEQPVPDDTGIARRLEQRPNMARARELHALGMDHDAYLEWKQLMSGLPKGEKMQAARLAYEWQWYARAILTLADADYWDDLDIRYPTPFASDIRSAASQNGLDAAYVYAIVRTESLFQPTVRSPVGARGLMQLMPGTADHVAARMGIAAPSAAALNDPSTNTTLGSRYLADMLADWSGNIALATASYNAGPRKVAQWLPDETMPADIWIATIPYTETRQYVQRVMSHMTVFQHRLSESVVPLDQRIDPVRPAYAHDRQTTF